MKHFNCFNQCLSWWSALYLPDLNTLTNYQNDKLIFRYNKDYPDASTQAAEALNELMKFIWLCFKHKSDRSRNPGNESLSFSCMIHPEMSDIDNMWHTFLLFTKDYHEFCNEYLNGIFFHHEPIVNPNDPLLDDNYEQELTLYLSYIYTNLGKDTLIKWFGECL